MKQLEQDCTSLRGEKVWSRYEPWQLDQLQRLARFDPERLETILNTVWAMYPSLQAELAVSAVEQGQLTVQQAAAALELRPEEVDYRVELFQEAAWSITQAQIIESDRGALVEDTQIPVWEIIREYRKLGTVERLTESFPSLSQTQLATAISYAREHPQEIEDAISAFEAVRAQQRAAYPFA